MALITSAASGNFNAGATWTGGVVPGVGDEARASTGHTITITANATCDEVSNAGTGLFILNDGVTLTANVSNKSTTANRRCLQFTASSPATATIIGNCLGGAALNAVAVENALTGTLNVTGNCTAGTAGGTAYAANNAAAGILNITGNCTGGSVSGTNQHGVNNASTGTINITGNCIGGTTSGGTPCGANNASTGTINITGNCTGANSGQTGVGAANSGTGTINITGNVSAGSVVSANGAVNNSTGILSVIGTIQASQTAAGVAGANVQQVTILSGPFLTETTRGVNPVYCAAWRWNASPSNSTYLEVMTNNLLTKRNLVTDDNVTGMPAPANVRSGTVYGPTSALTGTLSPTMSPSAADIRDAVWSAATRTVTGGTVNTLTNAPTVPSASAIASQVRTELTTELGRIDAAISTRATPANIPSADITAIKAKTDALNTTRLAQVSTTEIVGSLLAQANS